MKSIFILSFALLLCISGTQAAIIGNENWDKRFNAPGVEGLVRSMTSDSQYVYVAGTFEYINGTRRSPMLAKFDGEVWSSFPDTVGMPIYPEVVKMFNGILYATNSNGIYFWNGSWLQFGITTGQSIFDFDMDANGNVYVTGNFSSINGITVNGVAKWNGSTWLPLGTGINNITSSYGYAIHCMGASVYLAGSFNNVGGTFTNGFARWNGTSWASVNTGAYTIGGFSGMVHLNTDLYMFCNVSLSGGSFYTAVMKWDGIGLTQLGDAFNSDINQIVLHNSQLYVAGVFTLCGSQPANHLARWSGSSWTNEGAGLDMPVYAIALKDSFFLAGGSSIPTQIPYNFHNLAIKKNAGWMPSGNGISGTVNALLADSNYLYAGGTFSEAGGLQVNCIARWNGVEWDSLKGGMVISKVYDLIKFRDTLYAGGQFSDPVTLAPSYMVKWDGSKWVSIPGGVNYTVYALEVYNNELYVGGDFSQIGSGPANHIVKYDGNAWIPIGGFTNGLVKDIRFDSNGMLYAAGNFTTIGGVSANRIAKYNGSVWSAVGSGVDQIVNAIGISPNDELYIGGQFTLGYNVGVMYHIAKFNGTNWQAVGGGLGVFSSTVYKIDFHCNEMYVSGLFTKASADTVNNVVKWDGNNWYGMGSGLTSDGINLSYSTSIAFKDDHLWVGGSFGYAGGNKSDNIAAFNVNGTPLLSLLNTTSNYCAGDTITFSAAGFNLGSSPVYQWYVNNAPVGNNTPVFSSSALTGINAVRVVAITNPQCGHPDTVSSNVQIAEVNTLQVPLVSVSGNLFSVTNPDMQAVYNWQVYSNGVWNDLIPPVSGTSFQTSTPGVYRVAGSKGSCVKYSQFIVTGLADLPNVQQVFIAPNPAVSDIVIHNLTPGARLHVLDVLGKELLVEDAPSKSSIMDITMLHSGVYFLRVKNLNRADQLLRFVKQ